MIITNKKIIIFLLSISLLSILVLYDPRSSIITEPVTFVKAAISIAISYLVFGVDGFLGLREVYETLATIPSITNYQSRYYSLLGGYVLDFENINEAKEYGKIISNKIIESKNLNILNLNSLHVYQTDIGYVFYIILSFLLFGIKLKSISVLFLIIIILSAIIFMVNFHKNNLYFFLLQTIIFSLIIVIIGNYGGSVQTASTTNLRFVSILALIPAFHLSIIFFEKNIFTLKSLLAISFQFLLLVFLCLVRGTAMWSFLFLFLFYSIWILKIGSKNFSKYKPNILSMISTILLFLIIYNLSNLIIKQSLAEEYKDKSVITKHMVWHNLFMGISTSPKIHENYVCSKNKLNDVYPFKLKHIPCEIYLLKDSNKSELYKNVLFYQQSDNFSYHAVSKYIHDNNLIEKIEVENENALGWNFNWPRYEGILKILYFKILVNHPMEFLYMHLVVKPLKFLLEFVKFVFYFFNSFKINLIFISLIFISSLFIQLFCMSKIKIEKELVKIKNLNYKYLIETIFVLMFLGASIPSFIFYPASQAALPDCIVILITLIIFYLKKKLKKIL